MLIWKGCCCIGLLKLLLRERWWESDKQWKQVTIWSRYVREVEKVFDVGMAENDSESWLGIWIAKMDVEEGATREKR